ncbi:hypothetical protein [Roseateles chitosanitabidus]|uniref:hypothetical protein n=1 Tax=Roseateles chitosanitabidus TaxID=65048 RepID=UPI0011DFFB13|nr:hypothetical protein [Roseateles chitosanitabidus]
MRIDPRVGGAVAAGGLAIALAGWLALGDGDDRGEGAMVMAAAASGSPVDGPAPSANVAGPGVDAAEQRVPTLEGVTAVASAAQEGASMPASSSPGGDVPAAWSLADARVAGDDRTPPLRRSEAEPATPAWQLDDHQAYARREQDRHQAAQRAFVAAAEQALPELDQQIARGRAMGLSPEQLAKGEEKRRRIAEMQARLRAGLAASGATP